MKLLDVVNAPWAITPEYLREIRGIYETHLRGEKISIPDVEAKLGRPLEKPETAMEVIDGVAVVRLDGPLARRMNLMGRVSGGTSTELIARDLRQAADDPSIKGIVLDINSPGGTVDGTQELAGLVDALPKPVVALARGVMASAAYWIGSAADAVYLADRTTAVGSIGVVATHVDVSRAEQAAGIKTTEITAGRYKRIASNYQPLTDEGRSAIQDQVDAIYSVFVEDVAINRKTSIDDALTRMADGRIFIGDAAIAAGLADGYSSLDLLISGLSGGAQKTPGFAALADGVSAPITIEEEVMNMTAKELQEKYPEAVAEIREEILGSLDIEGDIKNAHAAGAAAERERIQSVRTQSLPGHEALIEALAMDGKTTGPEAAVAVLNAEKSARAKALADFQSSGPEPVPAAEPGEEGPATLKRAEFDRLPPAKQREALSAGVKIVD
jgi:signal peptide peptidase SppA